MSRKSRQKECILRVLKATKSHPGAEWLYQEARKEIPNLSLGTVYRNLRLLTHEGKISEVGLAGALTRYDGNIENHYHFRCEQCDSIFDLDEPVNTKLNQKIARGSGLKVSHHRLEFRGLCMGCQA
ncbi:MAG: transcriptional repressor [Chloroflexota bacterium]